MISPNFSPDAFILAASATAFTAVALSALQPDFTTSSDADASLSDQPMTDAQVSKDNLSLGDIEKQVVTFVTVEEVPVTPLEPGSVEGR